MRNLTALCLSLALLVPTTGVAQPLASLVTCRSTISVTGRLVYVGVYSYAGRSFELVFTSYCPPYVAVY